MSGPADYKLAYTADGQVTNKGEWGRVVMRYDSNGQTYGVRCDRADNADTVGGYTAAQLISRVTAVQQVITWRGSLNDNGVVAGTWNPPAGCTREQCIAIASLASAVAQVNTVCASAETDGRVILRSGNTWTITYEVRVLVVAIK